MNKVARFCKQCNTKFEVYPAWIRKGGGKFCSYRCMGDFKIGKATYVRTPEQNAAMSQIKKAEDNTVKRERFLSMNAAKKGKTLEELYGDKASGLRLLHKQRVGDKNSNWKGGKHRRNYPWLFFKLRPTVIARDGYVCMNCAMSDQTHRDKYSQRGLTVHHIDYDKENNELSNLITLCIWCNCKANGRRLEWQKHYSALLS
jgi:hypothetical protein